MIYITLVYYDIHYLSILDYYVVYYDIEYPYIYTLQISVPVNKAFIHYLHNYPLVLEAFGHYHHHPLHKASTEFDGTQSERLTLNKMTTIRSASPLPPSKFATSPVRSAKTVVFDATG